MKGMSTKSPAAVLLPLNCWEVPVVLDALVAFADREESRGDPLAAAPDADEVANRLRGLHDLLVTDAIEHLRAIGLGGYEGRHQG